MATISRSYSEKYLPGHSDMDLFNNRNTDWMNYPFVKLSYILLVGALWLILHTTTFFSAQDEWTVVNMLHGVVTFVIFHWIKDVPDYNTQGEYAAFTLYEMIDAQTSWTWNKKFLMLVPTFLAWISCHVADYKSIYVVVNCGIFAICIIAKLPGMHRVRILGINSTPAIDTNIDYTPSKTSATAGSRKKK